MSKNLLKEAIADAKAVRETAIANAKLALEEAFAPKIQSMLASKLSEEEVEDLDDEDVEDVAVADTPAEEPAADTVDVDLEDAPAETYENENEEAPEDLDDEEEAVPTDENEDEEGDDNELNDIIKELEADDEEGTDDSEIEDMVANDEEADADAEAVEDDVDAEAEDDKDFNNESLEEIIKSLTEDEDEEEEEAETEVEPTNEELEEAYKVIKYLRSKINEVNLLNAKLLFSNKIFRNKGLSESQKMKVIENFDRAKSVREVKLVYTTLSESLKSASKPRVTEGFASKGTNTTAPSKRIINENNNFSSRMKRLAGL